MSIGWRHSPVLNKVQLLEASLRCFTLGCLGLIPVLGLPAALLAMLEFRAVILRKETQWNAARPYLISGAVLAGIGLILSLLALGALILALISVLNA